MNRYKLTIEYKGTNFVGWQKQADNSNSIQEIIEKAIFSLTDKLLIWLAQEEQTLACTLWRKLPILI